MGSCPVVDTYLFLLLCRPQNSCGIASHNGVRRNILRDYTASADQRAFSNRNIGKNGNARTERSAFADARFLNLPIRFGLHGTVFIGGARETIVDEHYPMADEDVIFNDHALTYKGVAGNFAVFTYGGIFLDLDESTDLGAIANFAAVEVDKLGKLYIF